VKLVVLVAIPPGVVTDIAPEVAVAGTVAVIVVAEFTVNVAAAPLNFTDVAPRKFVPVSVTAVPVGPDDGVKEEITGGCDAVTVKVPFEVPVPPGPFTEIAPVTADSGTFTLMLVADAIVNVVVAMPPNFTAVAPVKFVPVIVTSVPIGPLAGENELIVGGSGITVKLAALVAVPTPVLTEIGPVVAAAGTFTVMVVEETTVKTVVAMPLNLMAVAPVKLVPVIVTLAPMVPLVGVKDVIVGAPAVVTVKLALLLAVLPGVVTEILPVVAPVGTVAVIEVAELTVNVVAVVPLNLTRVAPVKLVPVIVTVVPTGPLVGLNPLIVGVLSVITVKFEVNIAVPPGPVTEIGPVVVPASTVAVMEVAELTVNVAAVPLNLTAVTPVRLLPVIATTVPTGPEAGVKEARLGAGVIAVTVNEPELLTDPPGVATAILPVVAPVGTVAVIEVAELTVNMVAAVPLNLTTVAPVRFVPVIVTVVPTGPLVGVKEDIVGAGTVTVKFMPLVAVPVGAEIVIGPVMAVAGTIAVIEVAELIVKFAVTPLKATLVAPVKLVPVTFTLVPAAPLVGEKDVILGGLPGSSS